MMKSKFILLLIASFLFALNSVFPQSFVVKNNSDKILKDYTITISLKNVKLNMGHYMVISSSGEQLPLEIIEDIYGNQKAVFPIAELKPHTTEIYKIEKGYSIAYPKRTNAEISHKIGGHFEGKNYVGDFSWVKTNYMRKPDQYTDHSYYIKFEGPGWESDKAAFRFYLDWRNGVDVFAKKTPGIVLPFVGVDDYEKYHHMAIWGMDNLQVGKTLGLGSIAIWNGEKAVRVEKTDSIIAYIPTDGKVCSQVATTYYGWDANGIKCNLQSLISIDAGSRASHMELKTDKVLPNLATGIFKDKNGEVIQSNDNTKEWSYFATFGKQSMNNDIQGLAIFYRTKQLNKITEDELNHVIILNPKNNYVDYYFMETWELDWKSTKDKATFLKEVEEVYNRLNYPAETKFKK